MPAQVVEMKLRPYQNEAVEAVESGWAKGYRKQLLVLPTGCGKTIVFAELIKHEVANGGKVLVLAHREELLQQAADKIAKVAGIASAVEKGEQSAELALERCIVGSVQTLARENRRIVYEPNEFSLIVVDEAHHAVSPSYQAVLRYFDSARILGVTATADRGDKINLGEYFEHLAFEYSIYHAVAEGWLVRPVAKTAPLKLDLSGCKITAGDYAASSIGTVLLPYLKDIAATIKRECAERKTVIFLPLISIAQSMRDFLVELGVDCREVNGESTDRAEVLEWFAHAQKGACLCNAMLLTEGWDEPSADCIVCLRPTKIRSLYAQIVGRGTRLCEGKKNLLILDFLWLTGRHKLIRPAHLFTRVDDPEILDKVAEIEAQQAEEIDLLEVGEEIAEDERLKREEALARELENQRRKKARLVDPLQYQSSIAGVLTDFEPDLNDIASLAPPSEKQKAALENAGINPESVKYAGHASAILDTLATRRMCGLTTPKQIRFLEQKGFVHVGQWQFDEARKVINWIAANRWMLPRGFCAKMWKPQSLRREDGRQGISEVIA